MTDQRRFVRRNRVDERWALAIALASGILATFAGASPTGSTGVDAVLVVVSVGFVTWAAASAPWWASAAAAGIGAAIALDPIVALIGAAGFAAGLIVGLRRRDQSELRAVIGGIAANVLIRSDAEVFLGLSAVIAVVTCAALVLVGLRRRPRKIRRYGYLALGAAGVLMVIAMAALAAAGLSARPDLSAGSSKARQAITSLNQGDYAGAADLFAESSNAFARAGDQLGGALAVPSRIIPAVAINVDAGNELAAAAAAATRDAADALRSIDPATLRVVGGRIDLAAVSAVEAPLLDVQQALLDLRAVADDVESPWLLGALQDELAELHERLDANEPALVNAIDAVRLAPGLLGGDEPRRYLVMFTSPVEARGLAGFMGNYATVTIDDGQVAVDEFGRRSDLEAAVGEGASCTGCPAEVLDRYSRFGFSDGEGVFHPRAWSSITLPAHFPYVAEIAHAMFPQSGGSEIDGVIAMDPHIVQALMKYTGPIELTDLGVSVAPETAAEFLLAGQYALLDDTSNEERIEAIDTLGQQVIGALLAGQLPEPSGLARDLGPLIDEQRLLVWTDDEGEQELFERIGLAGALPVMGDDGGFAVTVANAGHSKIDYFLERDVDVAVETDADGQRTLVADVVLTNTAPSSGLPRYVIGNSFGLPDGTSRLWVSFYGPNAVPVATRNGEPLQVPPPLTEAGWWATSFDDIIGPGESVTYRVEYPIGADRDGVNSPVVWTQPLAKRELGN